MPEKYRRPHSHERVQAVEKMRRARATEREALGYGAPVQRNTLSQGLCLVLAEGRRSAHRRAQRADHQLR